DTIAGPWTQLGAPTVTTGGTTSVFDSTAPLEVGSVPELTVSGTLGGAISGKYIAFELRDGIGGTVVASPDFSAQAAGTTSFDDAQGNPWTVEAGAEITDRRYRFHGEIASWPATWRMGGHDAYVQITASGVKRRLTQNAPVIGSPMFRNVIARDSLVAYWPMEDSGEATQIASGLPSGPPMLVRGSPEIGGYSGWTSTDPVPILGTGRLPRPVPPYTATREINVRFFVFVDREGG